MDPIPLGPDRVDGPFIARLLTVLTAVGIGYWSIASYWHVDWFAREDGALEWASVTLYLASTAMAGAIAWKLRQGGRRLLGSMYVVLALLLLLNIGEEISWGQRIFGWSTPESLGGVNTQDETNLHNIRGLDLAFYTPIMWTSVLALLGSVQRIRLHCLGRITTVDFLFPRAFLIPVLLLAVVWLGDGQPFTGIEQWFPRRPVGSEFTEHLLAVFLVGYTADNLARLVAWERHQTEG